MLRPETVALTAQVRIAPAAIRMRLTPTPIVEPPARSFPTVWSFREAPIERASRRNGYGSPLEAFI
jgi:hypothetical protein